MKLEASPIRESVVRTNQIQAQLANLTLQLQDIRKGKEKHADIWCTRCHVNGHTKYTFLDFRNYLLYGSANSLSSGCMPWCHICQFYGHRHEECSYMQKMVSKPANLYCSFCRSIGHEDRDCRAYDLLQVRTYDSYFMKGEGHHAVQQPHPQPHMVSSQPQPQCTLSSQMQFMPPQPQSQLNCTTTSI